MLRKYFMLACVYKEYKAGNTFFEKNLYKITKMW